MDVVSSGKKLAIQKNHRIPFSRHFKYFFDILSQGAGIRAEFFGLQVVQRTSRLVGH